MAEGLADLQRRFWRLVTAPTPVAEALPQLAQDDPDAAPLRRWIAAPDEKAATERLDVYANMYFFRLLDVLKNDFPSVLGVVGDDAFHNLVTDYLLVHPSSHPSLRHLGAQLPGFVAEHPLRRRWPYLADLAALEWARVSVFDAPEAAVLDAAELQGVAAERWAELRFRTVPALRLLRLDYPVAAVWDAVAADQDPADAIAKRPTALVVWRDGFVVKHRLSSADEITLLAGLAAGEAFAAVCERAAVDSEAPQDAARKVFQLLQRWLADGLIASVR